MMSQSKAKSHLFINIYKAEKIKLKIKFNGQLSFILPKERRRNQSINHKSYRIMNFDRLRPVCEF